MPSVVYLADSLAATERLGEALAEILPEGMTVSLVGTLGAGKTRLVQAIATACGVPREQVVSPTYTLCHEYLGTRRIDHLDLYRVRDEDELLELGVEEYFSSPSLTFVEWGDRFTELLPIERLEIEIEVLDEGRRQFTIRAGGSQGASVLAALRNRLAEGSP